jgi:hypothetical protein
MVLNPNDTNDPYDFSDTNPGVQPGGTDAPALATPETNRGEESTTGLATPETNRADGNGNTLAGSGEQAPTEGNRVTDNARTVGDAIENAKRLDPNTLNPAELVAYQQAIAIESDIASLKKNGVDEAELLNMPIGPNANLATRELEIDNLRKDVETEKTQDIEHTRQSPEAEQNQPKSAEAASREAEEQRNRDLAEKATREAEEARKREEEAKAAKEAEEAAKQMGAALLAMSGITTMGNPALNAAVAGLGGKLMAMGIDPKSCEHRGGEALCTAAMHHGVAARGPGVQQQVGVA